MKPTSVDRNIVTGNDGLNLGALRLTLVAVSRRLSCRLPRISMLGDRYSSKAMERASRPFWVFTTFIVTRFAFKAMSLACASGALLKFSRQTGVSALMAAMASRFSTAPPHRRP